MSRSLFSVLVTAAFLFASCKPDPTSTNGTGGNAGSGTGDPPPFGYTLNGISFDRNDHPNETVASAIAGHYGSDNTLEVDLNFTPTPTSNTRPKVQFISFYMNHSTIGTATYVFDTVGFIASIVSDTMSYKAFPGGVLTITKFDTLNNLVSGTFHFIAYLAFPIVDSSVRDTVVNGSFTDVGIYEGSFGQGNISADVNGFHMSSKGNSSSNSSDNNAAAFTAKEYGVFTIHGVSNDGAGGNREIYLSLPTPGTGTFSLAGMVGPSNVLAARYEWWNQYTGADTEMVAPTGMLTISKFDAVTRRMSGTFFFSGQSYPGGDTIHVTNGVIDNVQWSVF